MYAEHINKNEGENDDPKGIFPNMGHIFNYEQFIQFNPREWSEDTSKPFQTFKNKRKLSLKTNEYKLVKVQGITNIVFNFLKHSSKKVIAFYSI